MIIFNSRTSKKINIIFLVFFFISIIISVLFFLLGINGTKKTFVFPSVEKNKYIVESRRLSNEYINPVEYYICELLLGSQTERTQSLFPTGTKLKNCICEGNILYVNLSKEMINRDDHMNISMRESVDLLRKNILNNFPSITLVEVFVDGNAAYYGY